MIFGGRFLKNEVVSITNSEAFASRKKAKTTYHSIVHSHGIIFSAYFTNLLIFKLLLLINKISKNINFEKKNKFVK